MKNWFKKLTIPNGEKTTVVAYNSWVVRWYSVDGSIDYFAKRCIEHVEIFPSEEDAYKFAEQMKAAWKLLKCEGQITNVKVEANQSKMATMVS